MTLKELFQMIPFRRSTDDNVVETPVMRPADDQRVSDVVDSITERYDAVLRRLAQ